MQFINPDDQYTPDPYPKRGISPLTLNTENEVDYITEKDKILSHLNDTCTEVSKENDEGKTYKCFGKYFKDYTITQLHDIDNIVALFTANNILLSQASLLFMFDPDEKYDSVGHKDEKKHNDVKTHNKQQKGELINILANIFADPSKKHMLIELSQKKKPIKKYLLIDSSDYFRSAEKNEDPPLVIGTNEDMRELQRKNPYGKKQKTTVPNIQGGRYNKKRKKTKKKNTKGANNKTKKVKRTNRKNSRYIKRK